MWYQNTRVRLWCITYYLCDLGKLVRLIEHQFHYLSNQQEGCREGQMKYMTFKL